MHFTKVNGANNISFIVYLTLLYVILCDNVCKTQNNSSSTISLAKYNSSYEDVQIFDKMQNIPPKSMMLFNITDLPLTTKYFLIAQIHSFRLNLTISYNSTLNTRFSLRGTNIGLYFPADIKSKTKSIQFYVFNNNTNATNALVVVSVYSINAPLPGGCNMEFLVETAPYLKISNTDTVIKVEAQAASVPDSSCENQTVKYDIYHMYLPEEDFTTETYFRGIKTLLTPSDITKNGRKTPVPIEGTKMRRIFSAYHGIGEVFTVVATYKNRTAAYVPIVTYTCSEQEWADFCDELTSPFVQTLKGIALFLGLFTCYFGHRFFKTGLFLLGFLSGGLISYIFISFSHPQSLQATITNSSLIGIATGVFWLSVWSYFGIPILSVTLANLILGFLLASILYYSGISDIQIMQLDINFWMLFVGITVTTAMVLSLLFHLANMLACSIVGSYCVIIPIDHYIGANMKYIFINIIRRAVDSDFDKAIIDPPYQIRDMSLTVLWISLAITGFYVQSVHQRGKPPFPPPPYLQRRILDPNLLTSEREPLITSRFQRYSGRFYGTRTRNGVPYTARNRSQFRENQSQSRSRILYF